MAEVQARSQAPSSRGRGGGRGGRGGFASRTSTNRRTNGDKLTIADATAFDDDGDVSQLRKQYGGKLDTIKELFPNWSDADILYALKETDGDVEVAATRIAEGTLLPSLFFATLALLPLRLANIIITYRYHLPVGRSIKAEEDHHPP